MKRTVGILAALVFILSAPTHARAACDSGSDIVRGKVVKYDSNEGIKDIVVRILKLNNKELCSRTSDAGGMFALKLTMKNMTRFNLRYEPQSSSSDKYFVAGRLHVERSGTDMHVDTMGLVSKNSTDHASAGKQQRDLDRYRRAGGTKQKVQEEIKIAKNIFGSTYDDALSRQPLLRKRMERFGINFRQ